LGGIFPVAVDHVKERHVGHSTMEDVARKAGVSRALVSLVLNDSPNVSDHRRRLVLDAAAELGYRRNAAARHLASRRTGSIGVLLNDLHNPFFADIYDGIAAATEKHGYRPLLTAGARRPASEQHAIDVMLEHRVDGMILVSPRLSATSIATASDIVPVVVIGRVVRGDRIDSVENDERHGALLVVAHLAALGHRTIVHIHGGNGAGARARWRGYEHAMTQFGLKPDVLAGDFTELAGVEAARRLLRRKKLPSAVFAANDLVAAGALDTFEDAGLRVPDDLSVVGYDNTFLARMHHVALTTVDQSTEEMGRTAVELLHQRVEDGRTAPVTHFVTPELVTRRTSGPRP
jgi:DNA-binding LacI/PurR family transcriptional regulator